jgi:hypothetical protein
MSDYPPYFELPRDERDVEMHAHTAALDDAYDMGHAGKEYSPAEIEDQARASCEIAGQVVTQDGKQGSNDPALFAEIWVATYVAQFPLACELFRTGQLVVDPAWTATERICILTLYAQRQRDGEG